MTSFTVACVQVNAGIDMDENIAEATDLVRKAHAAGARLVLMPENVAMMEWGREAIVGKARTEAEHPALVAFSGLARQLGLWLHCGTLAIALADGRVANRTYLIDPTGQIVVSYDKIHMFDVDLGGGESYRESAVFEPGDHAVLVSTPFGALGLTICYDVRFPHLYRHLAKAGADFLAVPAAFTRKTGRMHWHVLLRARAIETGCFVFAPAQCGEHAGGRKTFGHSLIVSPLGEVLAEAGEEPGLALARIDPADVGRARRMIPSLEHDRDYQG